MTCSRSSCASGDAYEASLVHRPCVPCVALSPLSHSGGRAGGWRASLCVSLIDRRHRAGKVVRARRENDGPLRSPRGIGRHHPPRGRTRLPRDAPIRRIVQNVLKMRRRRGPARSMVKVRPLLSRASHASRFCLRFGNCRLVEGEWTDFEIPDPLSDMFALLTARRNRALIQQWGVWLAGKDAERALKVGRCQPHIFFAFGYTSHERSRR